MPLTDADVIAELVRRAKEFALEHYNDSFEMSAFTECYDTDDWIEFIGELRSWAAVKRQILFTAGVRQAHRDDIEATRF